MSGRRGEGLAGGGAGGGEVQDVRDAPGGLGGRAGPRRRSPFFSMWAISCFMESQTPVRLAARVSPQTFS
ncbi:hypothetical protein AB0K09_27450, partial [Streptomyces sp. NPDC049577]|uniref:hypothetical protein n=1 Tax=Streptomyces sp. NPDC049577 TaxID=3155153 RepID=UPI00341DE5D1